MSLILCIDCEKTLKKLHNTIKVRDKLRARVVELEARECRQCINHDQDTPEKRRVCSDCKWNKSDNFAPMP